MPADIEKKETRDGKKDIAAKAQELCKYEFTDGKVTEKPLVILGPDGKNSRNMLRVYAYGGLIGCIAAEEKQDDNHHLADIAYAKYLGEAEAEYLQHMIKKYPDVLSCGRVSCLQEGKNPILSDW